MISKKTAVVGILLVFLYIVIDPKSLAKSEPVDLHVYIINEGISNKQIEEILGDYEQITARKTDHYLIENDIYISLNEPSPSELIDAGRFTAQVSAQELDLLIAEESIIEHYHGLGGFDYLKTDLEQIEGNLKQLRHDDGGVYAFKLNESYQLNTLSEDLWMVIPKTSTRKEEARAFMNYLMEGESN